MNTIFVTLPDYFLSTISDEKLTDEVISHLTDS